ncbi:MAG TPA: hypothetical protein VHP31_06410 [Caproicibacter sp.]|nr:hypothetical protein [Caproicibacter sp.]
MNCWEILGISPTNDDLAIKEAYEKAAALHRAEEDSEGYQAVNTAYQEALIYIQDHKEELTSSNKNEPSVQQQSEKSFVPNKENPEKLKMELYRLVHNTNVTEQNDPEQLKADLYHLLHIHNESAHSAPKENKNHVSTKQTTSRPELAPENILNVSEHNAPCPENIHVDSSVDDIPSLKKLEQLSATLQGISISDDSQKSDLPTLISSVLQGSAPKDGHPCLDQQESVPQAHHVLNTPEVPQVNERPTAESQKDISQAHHVLNTSEAPQVEEKPAAEPQESVPLAHHVLNTPEVPQVEEKPAAEPQESVTQAHHVLNTPEAPQMEEKPAAQPQKSVPQAHHVLNTLEVPQVEGKPVAYPQESVPQARHASNTPEIPQEEEKPAAEQQESIAQAHHVLNTPGVSQVEEMPVVEPKKPIPQARDTSNTPEIPQAEENPTAEPQKSVAQAYYVLNTPEVPQVEETLVAEQQKSVQQARHALGSSEIPPKENESAAKPPQEPIPPARLSHHRMRQTSSAVNNLPVRQNYAPYVRYEYERPNSYDVPEQSYPYPLLSEHERINPEDFYSDEFPEPNQDISHDEKSSTPSVNTESINRLTPKQQMLNKDLVAGYIKSMQIQLKKPFHQPRIKSNHDFAARQEISAEENKIQNFIHFADTIYADPKKRNSKNAWDEIFHSKDFLAFRKSPLFTNAFLSYLIDRTDIKSGIWKHTFIPALLEWSQMWQGSGFMEKFNYLMNAKKAEKKLKLSGGKNKNILIGLFVTVFIAGFILIGWKASTGNRYIATYSTLSGLDSSSEDDGEQATAENASLAADLQKIGQGILAGKSYSEMQTYCEDAGVNENQYDKFASDYTKFGKQYFENEYTSFMKYMLNQTVSKPAAGNGKQQKT